MAPHPLLIEPKCTEPYYTKPVEPIERYRHTQCRWTPLIEPSVQSPTTPNQYILFRNEDIPSTGGPPCDIWW